MADALVRQLNKLGYQPVFLPRTGVKPPELYSYVRDQNRLVRYGSLSEYLPAVQTIEPKTGQLGDISYTYTSEKKLAAAISFLENALKCIGISAVPKIDLGFTGTKEFAFAFTDVSYISLDPAQLSHVIASLSTAGIPRSVVEEGRLHVAYEYAYANELVMSRADRKSFSQDISGNVGAYIEVGVEGSVAVSNSSTVSFKNAKGESAAFAYKAGRLALEDGQWVMYPEEVVSKALGELPAPFLPQPAVVLWADTKSALE